VTRRAVVSRAACGLAGLAVSLHAPAARAQNASNQAAAEALFDQGKAAMAAKKYGEACPKFYESNRLDEGIGTSLWLAECYEMNGQTASAWAEFREAASLAVKAGDPREKVARARAQALEHKLSRLVIVVPPASRLPDLRVARDGGEVAAAVWGTPVPTDPGHHTLVVSAPDHRPATLSIEVAPGRGEQTITVPLLEEAPAPPAAAPVSPVPAADAPPLVAHEAAPADTEPHGLPGRRVAAIAVGAAGVVSVAVASYFGLHAMSELSDSNANGNCHAGNACNQAGVSDRSSAQSAATTSTVLFIVGGVALAGGVALWLTGAPHAATSTTAPASASASAPDAPKAFGVHSLVRGLAPWVDPTSHGSHAAHAGGVVVRSEF